MLWLDLRNKVSSFLCCGCCIGMGTETQNWADPRAKLLNLVVTIRAFKCTLTLITNYYHVCEVIRAKGAAGGDSEVNQVTMSRSLLKWTRAMLITVRATKPSRVRRSLSIHLFDKMWPCIKRYFNLLTVSHPPLLCFTQARRTTLANSDLLQTSYWDAVCM